MGEGHSNGLVSFVQEMILSPNTLHKNMQEC